MSELSKLNKRTDIATAFVDGVGKSNSSKNVTKQAKDWLREVEDDMLATVNKLLKKTTEKDAVTGAPRYGPNHVAKINALFDRINTLRETLSSILEDCGRGEDGHIDDDDNDDEMKVSEPPADAMYTDFDKNKSVFTSALGYTDSSRLQETVKTTMQRYDELRLLADAMDPMAHVKSELRASMQVLNDGRGKCKAGVERFVQTVHALRAEAEAGRQQAAPTNITVSAVTVAASGSSVLPVSVEYNHSQLQTTLKFLQSILVNICSHPDDVKLRRIRLQHPVVYALLSQIHGGVSLLTSCGFIVKCERSDEEAAEREAQAVLSAAAGASSDVDGKSSGDNVLGVDASTGVLPADTQVLQLLVCAQQLDLPVNAVLLEPSVEDTSKWVEWFDVLTALREACNKEVSLSR